MNNHLINRNLIQKPKKVPKPKYHNLRAKHLIIIKVNYKFVICNVKPRG